MCKIQYPDDKYVTLATTNWFIFFAVLCYLNEVGAATPLFAISLYFVTLFLRASFIFKASTLFGCRVQSPLSCVCFGLLVSGKVVTYFAGMSQTLS